jgi:hypothetical protein
MTLSICNAKYWICAVVHTRQYFSMSLPFLCTITELCQPKTSSTQNQKYLQSKKSKKAMQIDNVMWRHKHTLHYKLTMSCDVTKILCVTNWQCHVTSHNIVNLQCKVFLCCHMTLSIYNTKYFCEVTWHYQFVMQSIFVMSHNIVNL